jgi:hypothetical protein
MASPAFQRKIPIWSCRELSCKTLTATFLPVLMYTVIVAAITFVIGSLFIRDTRQNDINQ